MSQNPSANQSGFTLVELAIVLMIIGLLIGGILRGQELMENARVSSTVQQVNAYQGALTTFQDTYSMLPGDMPTATARVPGCNTANACRNGNGDGMIGGLVSGEGQASGQPWTDVPPGIDSENTQAWKQLAMAHLISGVNPGATEADWGASHPTAKIGGGFFMRFARYSAALSMNGHAVLLRNNIDGRWGGSGNMAISPMRASHIDRKMDDGIAFGGDVVSISSMGHQGCGYANQGVNGENGYNETMENKTCDMVFKIM